MDLSKTLLLAQLQMNWLHLQTSAVDNGDTVVAGLPAVAVVVVAAAWMAGESGAELLVAEDVAEQAFVAELVAVAVAADLEACNRCHAGGESERIGNRESSLMKLLQKLQQGVEIADLKEHSVTQEDPRLLL